MIIRSPKDAVNNGISLLTEDRKSQGLVLDMPCDINITLTDLPAVSHGGFMQPAKERKAALHYVDELSIKPLLLTSGSGVFPVATSRKLSSLNGFFVIPMC